ncbi:hypothetical protein D3C87_1416490 [compost metagenome]
MHNRGKVRHLAHRRTFNGDAVVIQAYHRWPVIGPPGPVASPVWLPDFNIPGRGSRPAKHHIGIRVHIAVIARRLCLIRVIPRIQRFDKLCTDSGEIFGLNQEVTVGVEIQVFERALLPAVGEYAARRVMRQTQRDIFHHRQTGTWYVVRFIPSRVSIIAVG